MGRPTRQSIRAAKAKLSGAIQSNSPKNKKIVFGDNSDDDSVDDKLLQTENKESDEEDGDSVNDEDGGSEEEKDESDDDDVVEEVKGSAARESTQKLREEERKVVKETITKKKRKKKQEVESKDESSESEEEEEEDDLFTGDFFKTVDSERADQVQKAKQEKKIKKIELKKRLGKHTTFVVEDEHKMTDAPLTMDQNIEIVAIGGGGDSADSESASNFDEERQFLISATLGSAPSKAAMAFARGGMSSGTSKERSSESRKRKSKNEETWKRSRKLNKLGVGSRPGRAAALFACKR